MRHKHRAAFSSAMQSPMSMLVTGVYDRYDVVHKVQLLLLVSVAAAWSPGR